jgi:hypothetical protein
MRIAVGVDVERVALRAYVEPEVGIELPRILDVGDREIEAVERMHAELAGTAMDRLRQRTDGGHRTDSLSSGIRRGSYRHVNCGKSDKAFFRSIAARCSTGIATPS